MALSWSRRLAFVSFSAASSFCRSSSGSPWLSFGDGVRIFEVQVVASGFDFVSGDLPGDFGFLAAFAFELRPTSRCRALRCSKRMGLVME